MIIQPDRIAQALARANQQESGDCPPLPGLDHERKQPAAVLIPLLLEDQGWKLLFIKRTHQLHDRHSGQIAFPGGRRESGDATLLDTALREAREEIGLDPGEIRILGQSCTITTVTGYQVTPFVGVLPWPTSLSLSGLEVEKTLTIPLAWLLDPQNRRTVPWQSPQEAGREIPVIFFHEFEGEVLWGATARIVADFLDLIRS